MADPSELADGQDPRPIVRLPRPGLPGGVIAGIAGLLALLLLLVLNHHRLDRDRTIARAPRDGGDQFPAPPPLQVPPERLPPVPVAPSLPSLPPPVRERAPLPPPPAPLAPSPSLPAAQSPQPEAALRRPATVARALVYDGGSLTGGDQPTGAVATTAADDTPVATTVIRNRSTIMPTGTVIPAVLETPINSTRPGLVRAIVSDDARGFDGRRVLIPRGSRLIGEYASDVSSAQKRVLVTWSRLIRPDGVAIRIGSPAADTLGQTGIPGSVNTFFFRRFAGAVLQSALQVGVNLASRPGNGSVIVGLPTNTGSAIGQDLIPRSDLRPRIKVREGAVLTIFVAHDLDFSGAPPLTPSRP